MRESAAIDRKYIEIVSTHKSEQIKHEETSSCPSEIRHEERARLKTVVALLILFGKSHNTKSEKFQISSDLVMFIIEAYLLLQRKDDKAYLECFFHDCALCIKCRNLVIMLATCNKSSSVQLISRELWKAAIKWRRKAKRRGCINLQCHFAHCKRRSQ